MLLEDVENAFEMVPLALHGPEDELEELLVDVRDDFLKLWMAGVRVGKHDLDDLGELLLEDLFYEFAGGALWDGLRGLALIGQLLLLCSEIGKVGILLTLPCHVVVKEVLDELAEPYECLALARIQNDGVLVSLRVPGPPGSRGAHLPPLLQQELVKLINDLFVQPDTSSQGMRELLYKHGEQLHRFLAHIRPLIQVILHVYVRQQLVQEVRDAREDIHVLD